MSCTNSLHAACFSRTNPPEGSTASWAKSDIYVLYQLTAVGERPASISLSHIRPQSLIPHVLGTHWATASILSAVSPSCTTRPLSGHRSRTSRVLCHHLVVKRPRRQQKCDKRCKNKSLQYWQRTAASLLPHSEVWEYRPRGVLPIFRILYSAPGDAPKLSLGWGIRVLTCTESKKLRHYFPVHNFPKY